jgi:hypothetical protein
MATIRPAPSPAPVPRPVGAPATAAAKTAPKPASRLAGIKREKLKTALRYMFYGPEGVGKTSLVADSGALFADVEGGSDEFKPRNYDQLEAAIDDLLSSPGHGFTGFAIDTVTALEAIIHRHICARDKKSGIESYGFGKGYKIAVEQLRVLLAKLDLLRAQGVSIFLIGHSNVQTFKNPEGEDFDYFSLHAHRDFAGQLKQWCDVVGFIQFEGGAKKLEGDESQSKRARGWTTNRRLIQLARSAAWDAKSRLSLPAEIELAVAHPWAPFAAASLGAREADADSLREQVRIELDRIGAEEFTTNTGVLTTRQAVLDMSATADATTLSRIVAGLQSTAAHDSNQENR